MSDNDSTRQSERDPSSFNETANRETTDSSLFLNTTPQSPSFVDATRAIEFELNTKSAPFRLPYQLGNYLLTRKVGSGGAGIVYQATSNVDQSIVAVKVIRPEVMASQTAVRRFAKEARLHGEISSPYVTRLIELNQHQGSYYMVSEFVPGVTLRSVMLTAKKLPVNLALLIIRDVLRALTALHQNNVVHRDVKPENIMAIFSDGNSDSIQFDKYQQIKLTDFGLARHIEQTESMAMTRHEAILGTPLYMAPEQHSESRSVDARADVYSTGATLYHLLSGHPPLNAPDFMALAKLHQEEKPKPLTLVDPAIGEAISNVVAKSLEKELDLRYSDAAEMLVDIERILAGQPTTIRNFPATPDTDNSQVRTFNYDFELSAPIANLWPLVADTDRFNRAMGLPAPQFSHEDSREADANDRRVIAEATFHGMKVRWREYPFQWIFHRNLSVLREFESGPFQWMTSTIELAPLADQRTRLIHRFQVLPRGWIGRLLTPLQFGLLTKRSLTPIYQRLERIANDNSTLYACHVPFGNSVSLSRQQSGRLIERIRNLSNSMNTSQARQLTQKLSDYLTTVADPIVSRIRPKVFAKETGFPLDVALDVCFYAVPAGLLKMSWDIICPVCRIAANHVSTLENIKSHASCEACNLEFEVDFARSVELVFSAHPEIRSVDTKTYCIGGPYHAPHVLAQSRLLAGEHVEIGTEMRPGNYQVRGPQLATSWKIQVDAKALTRRIDIQLTDAARTQSTLTDGLACIGLHNHSGVELLTRLELNSDRDESITAAAVSQLPRFKKMFPREVVDVQQLIQAVDVSLLACWDVNAEMAILELGEIEMRNRWQEMAEGLLSENATGCQIVEMNYDGLLMAFEQKSGLVSTSLSLCKRIANDPNCSLETHSFAIHRGELISNDDAGNTNFFGQALREIKAEVNSNRSTAGVLLIPAEQLEEAELQPMIQQLTESKKNLGTAIGNQKTGSGPFVIMKTRFCSSNQ